MSNSVYSIALGGLLHDIGKVVNRIGEKVNHSELGYREIKNINQQIDQDILNSINYHHKARLSNADIPSNSSAYITYIADNIAAAADRRDSGSEEGGFDIHQPLQSVFNTLNGNDQKYCYAPKTLDKAGGINYPSQAAADFSGMDYNAVWNNIRDALKRVSFDGAYVNSLLQLFEADLSFVPSSTKLSQNPDISLYDHCKLTAAIACCIFYYLEEQNINDYKSELFINENRFYDKKAFLMFSCDMSGIQDFIYTISTDGVLKTLRARSFYLEILLEHIVDMLLEDTGLFRTNLIYTGGGHAYILLPNTAKTKKAVEDFQIKINKWLMKHFGASLYMAAAVAECSANSFMNKPENSYKEIFKSLSGQLSSKKLSRYGVDEIRALNGATPSQSARECRICKTADNLTDQDICTMCQSFKDISNEIINNDYFFVLNEKPEDKNCLVLPGDKYLIAVKKDEAFPLISQNARFYSKNNMHTGKGYATNLWVGDYKNADDFEELAESAEGIKRIAVVRGDVDNLGRAFTGGFPDRYNTLSRTAALSRQLSMFFKFHINQILESGQFKLKGDGKKRKAVIVYSGGDDFFIVGSWNDAVELSVDLRNCFKKYSQNTLTLSAGIGIYPHKYPMSRIAFHTGELEGASKTGGKNALTLFDAENRYDWDAFEQEVVGEKLRCLQSYFGNCGGEKEKGSSLLYKLLELLRRADDRINIARFLYLIARLEPDRDNPAKYENYLAFKESLHRWILDKEQRGQLKTAIYIYIYLERTDRA